MELILTRKFTSGDVIKAAGITNDRLQTWLRADRYIIGHRNGAKVGTDGPRRTFSFYNVMEIALATELILVGLTVEDAFKTSVIFSHAGEVSYDYDDIRCPGLPFQDGITLFVANLQHSETINWLPGQNESNVMAEIFLSHVSRTETLFRVINMSKLYDRVASSLNFHPDAELAKCYAPGPASTFVDDGL